MSCLIYHMNRNLLKGIGWNIMKTHRGNFTTNFQTFPRRVVRRRWCVTSPYEPVCVFVCTFMILVRYSHRSADSCRSLCFLFRQPITTQHSRKRGDTEVRITFDPLTVWAGASVEPPAARSELCSNKTLLPSRSAVKKCSLLHV